MMPENYHRILAVKSLSEVENPWKGISLNHCIFVALAVVVVSSGLQRVQETLEPFFEVSEDGAFLDIQDEIRPGEIEPSWWDGFAFWTWKADDENRAAMQLGTKSGPKGIRKREMPRKKLLKDRD